MADNDNKTTYTPILPFDVTFGEYFNMYDNMTYYRDKNLCNEDAIKRESGNVIKYYRCEMNEPARLGGDSRPALRG